VCVDWLCSSWLIWHLLGYSTFSRNRIVCACVWRLSAIWCRRYLFFLLIDRYIVFVERRLTSRKAERFIVTRQFSSVGAKLFSFHLISIYLFFFFFHLWRTKQEGEYVLEKQVNGQGVSPYDPSHNSTAVLVGKPNLWFVISQWTVDEIRDISSFFFYFVSTWMWTDVCNFHRRS
jgi:hypothetical protein